MVGAFHLLPQAIILHIVYVYLRVHAACHAIRCSRVQAEGNSFHRVGVLAEYAASFACVVIAEAYYTVKVARYNHRLCWMQLKYVDAHCMEVLVHFGLPYHP